MEEVIDLGPAEVDILVSQDADFVIGFVLTDGLGVPLNITGDTIKLTIKDYIGGTQKIQKVNTSHSDPANGYTIFVIGKTDIAVSADKLFWVYEVRRIQGGGNEAVHLAGDFIADSAVGD